MKFGKLAAMALASSLCVAAGFGSDGGGMGHSDQGGWIRLHEGAAWYRTRPEPEDRWTGVLRRRLAGLGPDSRTALGFALVTAEGDFPVYAAGIEAALEPFLGRHVEVVGKIVDLRQEGFGRELWIGSLRPADLPNQQK